MMIKNVVRRKPGFSLVELLVAMAITGLLGGAVATAIIQMFDVNNQNTNAITAQRQVQQVGYYMSRDGQNAQVVDHNPGGSDIAVFSWTDWDGNQYEITYTLADGVLKRYESKNGDVTSLRIATDIEPSTDLAQQVDGESNPIAGFYSLTVTATVTGKNPISETRIYEIRQRTVS